MNGKRIAALCCALLLLASAAGCSKPVGGNESDTEAVYASLKKLEDCTSCISLQTTERAETVTEGDVTYSFSETVELEITLITSPTPKMRVKTRAHTVYDGEDTNQSTVSYIVPENGGYCEYFYDGSEWYSVFTENNNTLSDITVANIASMFMLEGLSFGKAKTEDLDNGKASRYDAALSGT